MSESSDDEARPAPDASSQQDPAPEPGSAPRIREPRPNRPRPQQQQPIQPERNHAAYITDDSDRWPELHSLGPIDQDGQHCKGCGAAHWYEERTKNRRTRRDRPATFNECCKHNTIRLPPVSDPFPEQLKALFTGEGLTYHDVPVTRRLREDFCNNTRAINNKLAFACITNTNQDKAINESRPGHTVPWVYRIHGQMYRQIGPAQARTQAVAAQYSQLYFHDVTESLESIRLAFETNAALQSIVQNTHMWLRDHNPFGRHYKTLRELIDHARENDEEVPLYSIQFNSHIDLDHRTYNPPAVTQTEVAAILLGERCKQDRERTLTVTSRSVEGHENFSVVKCTCPQAEALCYPVLRPRGDLAWANQMPTWVGDPPPPEPVPRRRSQAQARTGRRFIDDMARASSESSSGDSSSESDEGEFGQAHESRRGQRPSQWQPAKKITMLDFFAYRMHWRKEGVHPNNKFDPLFWARRLFQQYAVDAFSKVEENTLNYYRRTDTQKKLRAESYETLQKYVQEQAAERGMRPGKPVVLPTTFAGSARHMAQEYKDAMAIVRKKGRGNGLDYFLTMTANSDWDEITSSLPRDANGTLLQKATDRPDLVARVFKLKLDAMLEDVLEKQILGKVAAYAWTLEYQVVYS